MLKRIEALESKILTDDEGQSEGVFCYVEDASLNAPRPEPVQGWRHNEHRIMRMEGETDEALEKRAIEQVKPSMGKMAIPVFLSIDE
jgi:hypothetical protein